MEKVKRKVKREEKKNKEIKKKFKKCYHNIFTINFIQQVVIGTVEKKKILVMGSN